MAKLRLPLLAGAVGISALGDMVAVVPVALHLQERTGSGLVVAAVFVALWAPIVALAGPAGLLVDRVEPRRVLIAAVLAQAAVASVLAFHGWNRGSARAPRAARLRRRGPRSRPSSP
jgi:MFS family permease